MRLAAVLALAACRGAASGPTIGVDAYFGYAPAGGVTVISQHPDGEVIDSESADAVGHASVVVTGDALISIVFADPTFGTAVVTAQPPSDGSDLVVHGPVPFEPPTVAGALQIVPMAAIAADDFAIDLGCQAPHAQVLPAVVDVDGACLGSDANLDVLVRAFQAGQLVGYAATRLDFSAGAAEFDIPSWSTDPPSVPITETGVTAAIDWTLTVDGLPFDAQPLGATGPLWTGLVVDGATVHAEIAAPPTAEDTTRQIQGAPTAIAFTTDDFLPTVAPSLVLDTTRGTALAWAAADAAADADAIDVQLGWTVGGNAVAWDAVLPPDAGAVALPDATGDLASALGPPDATPAALLRYVDTSDYTGYDALLTGDLFVMGDQGTSTIAPVPRSGEIRTASVSGYAP
ncbi:MAG TPA: hypothetical protein VLX92_30985 [Kofleriaceae bacterium]|nr:hypothetical protein [Kofleriaceae bacterium]